MTSDITGPKDPVTVAQKMRNDRKDPGAPDGFSSIIDFTRYAARLYGDDVDTDASNRDAAIEDLKFMAGDQWDGDVVQRRKDATKPVLTLNKLPAFIGQLVGNRKLNQIDIKIIPDNGGTKDIARIREGLVRSIQKTSGADFAYDKAFEGQVMAGMGNWKIELEFAHDDVFEQDIKIKAIANHLSVVWDRMSIEPTGQDAKHVFVVDSITREEFRQQYPSAAGGSITDVREWLTGHGIDVGWYDNDNFRVVEFWRMKSRRRIVALLKSDTDSAEPQVEDITDRVFEEIADRIVTDQQGLPIMRETDRLFAEMYLVTATDILEGPYELPISRVPVFKATGWEVNVGDKTVRFGLIRFMKDPQRLHNYWRSIVAEKLMGAPRATWMADARVVEGREKEWRESNTSKDSLLIYNGEAGAAPTLVPPHQLEGALLTEAGLASQDFRDISNIHEAGLGKQSNEVSGKAIIARQRVGEVGTAIYETNLQMAIEATGRVINELIPTVYDTMRTIKILGDEGKDIPAVVINDETDESSVDITRGKYSVTSIAGPSTPTKRAEASESMLNMVNAAPQAMGVVLDKVVEAQDWPGASEIAARLRTQLPPGIIQPDDMSPEEQAVFQQTQAVQQAAQQREDIAFQADLAEKTARTFQAESLGMQARANAAKTLSEQGLRADELAQKTSSESTRTFLEAVAEFQAATKDE